MKKAVCILIISVLLSVFAVGAAAELGSDEISCAVSIIEECDGKPEEEELKQLYGLGLSDEDINGLTVIESMRKDNSGIIVYVTVAAVIAALSAAAAILVIKTHRAKQ